MAAKKGKLSGKLSLIIVIVVVLYFGFSNLYDFENKEFVSPLIQQQGEFTAGEEAFSTAEFAVYFIDVGQADAALIQCAGQYMLIDGGNVADSSLIVATLKKLGVEELELMVCTHAHEDHVGGLSGALNAVDVKQVLCPVTEYSTKAFNDFLKYVDKQGLELTVPQADDIFYLGGCLITVLAPREQYDDANNTSIVLRIDYGETSFIFAADAERESELAMIDAECRLEASVLKVGHHGSSSSSSYVFLREVMPTYAVISCEDGNSYGHPHEETLSRLRDAGVTLYRTDLQGAIICTSDGMKLKFFTEKSATEDELNPTKLEKKQ